MLLSNLTMLVIFSILYVFGVTFLYFSKERIKNEENKVYKVMLIVNIIGLILQLLCDYVSYKYDVLPVTLSNIVLRAYLVYFIVWLNLLFIYLIIIAFTKKDKLLKIVYGTTIVEIIVCLFLPYTLYRDVVHRIYYTVGMGINFVFLLSGIICTIMFFILLIKRKEITIKKTVPIYVFIVCGVISAIVQKFNPELVIITTMESFICCLMYFTIENPDVQMINELYKNKMLVEKTYEEKSNFLFKMTQEVKKPITNMNNILASLKMSDEKNELKQGVKLLEANGKQLSFVVNDVLDITTLDARNIKIMNSRYNVYTLFKDIEKRMAEYASDEVEFRFEIDDNIPYLYGDAIKLKQIVMSILLNSIKKTKSGFIELTVNFIMKYDVCRLIIEVEDSGVGMSIDKINELMVTTSELSVDEINNLEKIDLNLDLCQKSIKLLGGNLMIRSEVGKGTEVIITLDQKIYESESKTNEIEKYQNMMYNDKRILIVSEKEDEIEKIKKRIEDKTIIVSTSLYANDAIDKIRSGKKYDLILMSDEMESKSGLTTLRELKGIKEFDMPVVVMLESDKEKIKEHYIEDGFKDYLLLSDIDTEIKRILDKYC